MHDPQNTPILWKCIIAGSTLRAIHTLNPPKKYIRKLGVLSPIHLMRQRRAQDLMWGARGAFSPTADMVVAVVMPVVLCTKAAEYKNKNTKIICLLRKSLVITIYCKTYCNSYIANCSVVEPELWCGRSPNHFGPTEPRYNGYKFRAYLCACW